MKIMMPIGKKLRKMESFSRLSDFMALNFNVFISIHGSYHFCVISIPCEGESLSWALEGFGL